MIEYLNGPVTSGGGAGSAENGHPELIRREIYRHRQRGRCSSMATVPTNTHHYVERFNLLHDAIKGKRPVGETDLHGVVACRSPSMERTFRRQPRLLGLPSVGRPARQRPGGRAELRRMRELLLRWNPSTTMKCAIFEENGQPPRHAACWDTSRFRTLLRRMGDFVLTS